MTLKTTFKMYEIAALEGNPDALRALANHHDMWEVEFDARSDEPLQKDNPNAVRARELRALADKIESEY